MGGFNKGGFSPSRVVNADLEVDDGTISVDAANNKVGLGTTSPKTKLTVEGAITLKEQANADSDSGAYGQLWVKSDTPNNLYFTDDAGNDVQITSGGSLAGVAGSLSGLGSTDNAIMRTNGTGGETAQGSGILIDDSNNVSSMGTLGCGAITSTGRIISDNTTDASSKTDGSLQTDGGLSVAKAIYNGTAATLAADSGIVTVGSSTAATFSAAGLLNINNTTDATSTTDGSLQTDGGISVAKDGVIGNDLILLSDAAVVHFGTNKDVTLTHVADVGLTITHTGTGDNLPVILQLKSEEDAVIADEVIASLEFAAGDSDGTDGATVAAGIHAIAEETFAADANATKLVFTAADSETAAASATAKMTLASTGNLTTAGSITAVGSFIIGSADLNETDLEKLDGITNGAGSANKCLVLDGNADIASGLRNITITGTFSDGNYTFDTSGNVSGLGTVGSGAITSSGIIKTDDTTDATSTTDGSLQTDGGLSVVKDVIAGNDVKLLSDSSVLALGAGSDFTITHDGTTGATLAGNPIIVDSGASLTLDAHNGIFIFKDAGSEVLRFTESGSGDVTVKLETNGKDLIFTDNGDAEGFRILDAAAGVTVAGDITVNGGDIQFGSGQNATVTVAATATNVAGKAVAISAGNATAGTHNDIAGGDLTISGGQGKGTGSGGDIVFKVSPPAGSTASSLNALATALKLENDGDIHFATDGVSLAFGADEEVTLSHVHNTGLLLSDDSGIGTTKLMFGDDACFIQQQADGQLGIDADSIINLTAPTLDVDASTAVTIDGPAVTIADTADGKPVLTLKTTHTTTTSSSELQFLKDAADTQDGEVLGQITFYGEDEGNNNTQFAGIVAEISESDDSDEAGKLSLFVAESDGTTTAMTAGLILEGEHATDGQIDVTIAAGSASTTTVAGELVVGGGELAFGNGQNAEIEINDTAHNAAGKTLTIAAGAPTAGTTNNIAGGDLTIQGGQGKGTGAGGSILFQVATRAGGSASSLNSYATALTIMDDKLVQFGGKIAGGLEIESVNDAGASCLLLDNDDTDQIALNVDAANIDANVVNITADALTTSAGIALSVDALTSGQGIDVSCSNNSLNGGTLIQAVYSGNGTNNQSLVKVHNDHASATGTIPIEVIQDSTGGLFKAAYGANGSAIELKVTEYTANIATSGTTTTIANVFTAGSIPIALGVRVTTQLDGSDCHITAIGRAANGAAGIVANPSYFATGLTDGVLEQANDTSVLFPNNAGEGGSDQFFGIGANTDLTITTSEQATAGAVRIAYYHWALTPPTS